MFHSALQMLFREFKQKTATRGLIVSEDIWLLQLIYLPKKTMRSSSVRTTGNISPAAAACFTFLEQAPIVFAR